MTGGSGRSALSSCASCHRRVRARPAPERLPVPVVEQRQRCRREHRSGGRRSSDRFADDQPRERVPVGQSRTCPARTVRRSTSCSAPAPQIGAIAAIVTSMANLRRGRSVASDPAPSARSSPSPRRSSCSARSGAPCTRPARRRAACSRDELLPEDDRVLDRLRRALPAVRRGGMRGITDEHDATAVPRRRQPARSRRADRRPRRRRRSARVLGHRPAELPQPLAVDRGDALAR